MNVSRPLSILLAPTLLLLPLGGLAAVKAAPKAKAAPGFTSRVSAPSARVKAGGTAALSVSVVNQGATLPNGVVDLEVYDAKGKKVGQQSWERQTLTHGRPSVFHWAWKPAAGGAYTVKLGVFGNGWKPEYHWNDRALVLTVA